MCLSVSRSSWGNQRMCNTGQAARFPHFWQASEPGYACSSFPERVLLPKSHTDSRSAAEHISARRHFILGLSPPASSFERMVLAKARGLVGQGKHPQLPPARCSSRRGPVLKSDTGCVWSLNQMCLISKVSAPHQNHAHYHALSLKNADQLRSLSCATTRPQPSLSENLGAEIISNSSPTVSSFISIPGLWKGYDWDG